MYVGGVQRTHTHGAHLVIYVNRLLLLMMRALDICEKCKRGGQRVVLKFDEAHMNSPGVYWS